jgi:hypothetical protein
MNQIGVTQLDLDKATFEEAQQAYDYGICFDCHCGRLFEN